MTIEEETIKHTVSMTAIVERSFTAPTFRGNSGSLGIHPLKIFFERCLNPILVIPYAEQAPFIMAVNQSVHCKYNGDIHAPL